MKTQYIANYRDAIKVENQIFKKKKPMFVISAKEYLTLLELRSWGKDKIQFMDGFEIDLFVFICSVSSEGIKL